MGSSRNDNVTVLRRVMALCLTSVLFSAPHAFAADLAVTVEGIQKGSGTVVFGLYDSKKEWPQGKAAYKFAMPAASGHVTYIFKDLAPGRYALTGYHDENGNGKMDYSFMGLPEEGFFFSNDQKPGLSTPSFESCAVDVANASVAITVHVQHWG